MGLASKIGPNEKMMENSRMSLTLIGQGTTSVNPSNANLKEITHENNTTTRQTIVKVIFISINCLHIIGRINIYRPIFEICL